MATKTTGTKGFSIVVAATRKGGIGKKGTLPWPRLQEDLAFFHTLTTSATPLDKDGTCVPRRNAVIMGRVTWESLPMKTLKGRLCIVLSSQGSQTIAAGGADGDDVRYERSFEEALAYARSHTDIDRIFVIGGGMVYNLAAKHPACERIYLTQILREYPCDTFFHVDTQQYALDVLDEKVRTVAAKEGKEQEVVFFQFLHVPAPNPEEQQYLDLVREVLHNGVRKSDRTGVGTLSTFGHLCRYSLRDGKIPLLTTKRVFWRGVVEELIWILKGETDAKTLQAKGVRIWDSNGTRTFLDSIGQGHREEFDLGPVYGHQWRHYNAPYVSCHTDYTGQGVDQLSEVVSLIKHNPESRRILLTSWNPCQLKEMALPPCHVLCQFKVVGKELSCLMYQRSCDLGLGVPFNIASYSLLTHVLAQVCGLRAAYFIHAMGDCHVYLNHVAPLTEQIDRTPTEFPTVRFKRPFTEVTGWSWEDVELIGYEPQAPIKMSLAV